MPGALIDAAGNPFEAHGDLAVAEVRDVLGDRIGEIGVGLHPVEEFGIAVAIERARLVGDAGCGLPLLPLPAVDGQHLVVAFALDPPDADDAHERFRLGADGLVGKIELQGLRPALAYDSRAASPARAIGDRAGVWVSWLASILGELKRDAWRRGRSTTMR